MSDSSEMTLERLAISTTGSSALVVFFDICPSVSVEGVERKISGSSRPLDTQHSVPASQFDL